MKFMRSLLLRWLICSLGLWTASGLLRGHISFGGNIGALVWAGLILAILNIFLKPICVLLSLPALIFTLGLFMVVINGFLVFLVSKFYPSLHITNFWAAVFAGMVVGLVNYMVTQFVRSS